MIQLRNILIIDDDQTNNFVTEMILNPMGLFGKIECVLNGNEAIDYFKKNSTLPDLVLLDINMPVMNGFEFLDWYESNGYSGSTKFSLMSATVEAINIEKASKYKDVLGYIEKPIQKRSILDILKKII